MSDAQHILLFFTLPRMFLLKMNNWPWYKKADVALLRRINTTWSNETLDGIIPWLRESMIWIPLYLALVVFAISNLGRKAIFWILGLVVTVTISDQVSSSLIKKWVARERPCRDPDVLPLINLKLEYCSGAFSFTSSHASNHFAVATFIIGTLYPMMGKWVMLFWLWAAAISYAQVYVGVHYPLDVAGGAMVGLLIGIMTGRLYNRFFGLPDHYKPLERIPA